VNAESQAVLFNAVPLLLLAALYLAVGVAIAPALWRERGRTREIGFGLALVFPCLGLAAAILGAVVLVGREPVAGDAFASLAAIVLAALPLAVVARNWADRALLVGATRRTREAEQRSLLRDRELAGVGRLSHQLLDADDADDVARLLLDELTSLFSLDVANLALVEPGGTRARVVAAREGGEDTRSLVGQELDLEHEMSGISTVVREGAAFAVYDAEASAIVNRRLNEIARVKSCAFVPVRSGEEVIGVVFAGVRQPRLFDDADLALMQTFATEAGLAIERTHAVERLAEALERERLLSRVSLEIRSRGDVDELLRTAVEEVGRATGALRCFIRLGDTADSLGTTLRSTAGSGFHGARAGTIVVLDKGLA
jgi:GAF domain-containing protein